MASLSSSFRHCRFFSPMYSQFWEKHLLQHRHLYLLIFSLRRLRAPSLPLGSGLINCNHVDFRYMTGKKQPTREKTSIIYRKPGLNVFALNFHSHGVRRVDDRTVLSGIINVIKNGLPWKDAPVNTIRAKLSTSGSSGEAAWESLIKFSWSFPGNIAPPCCLRQHTLQATPQSRKHVWKNQGLEKDSHAL